MKHLICFSGGEGSALTAIEVVRKYGKDDVILINHECCTEDADVARFEHEVAAYLGLPITEVNMPDSGTKDQFDVCMDRGMFIYANHSRQLICTTIMKTEPFMQYLALNFIPADTLFNKAAPCIVYYGFDATEPDRMLRRSTIMAVHGYKTQYPIALWPRTIHSTLEIGIKPPLTYGTFKHANCIGCLKAGWQHWYCVYVLYPHLWSKGKQAELFIGHSIHNDFYLEEKEPLFQKMVAAGIVPTEHMPFQTFWAMVKKLIPACDIDLNQESKPCECITQ